MLTSRQAALALNKIDTSINNLTDYKKAGLPATNDPQETAAGLLWLARAVKMKAVAKCEAAEKEALLNGIIVDKDNSPLEPGPATNVWTGEHFNVVATVKNGSEGVSGKNLILAMRANGISREVIDKCLAMSGVKTMTKNAHTFMVVPRVDEDKDGDAVSSK